ncbi:MAG: endonuclease/exonuclease/phosphatase family protein, partial [Candidatus Lokiarchaeota archaeon]|nr:endonuclease/exonuclease/phosphatase family protein [Candidatus Lokiarchaeota archaeon]
LEMLVVAALGCSFALFPIVFAVHLVFRCFAYTSRVARAAKGNEEGGWALLGNRGACRVKLGFLNAFLVVIAAALHLLPVGMYFLFPGIVATYYYVLFIAGVAIAVVLNVVRKPHGLPGFLSPWRPSRLAKRAVQVAVVAFPVLCGAVMVSSGVFKYHAPAPAAPTSAVATSTRLVTYNIRLGVALEENPANNWVNRRDALCAYLATLDADIIGVQEAYQFQLEDIKARVNPLSGSTGRVYKYTGFGRDDGVHGGEHSAILFDATKFSFQDGDTFWLSPFPDFPSKPWDPSNYRVCTWARFERAATGAQFVVFCTHYATGTHYDTFHEPASALIKARMPTYAGGLPVFLMGDLNMRNTTHAFEILRDGGPVVLSDTYTGPPTYSFAEDFDATAHPTGNQKIDFILVNGLVTVSSCTIPRDWYGANQTYSDHYPVVVDCSV